METSLSFVQYHDFSMFSFSHFLSSFKRSTKSRSWNNGRVCKRRLSRLIAYIHHTNDHRKYCHVDIKYGHSIADCTCYETQTLLKTSKTRNQLWVESYVSSDVGHLFHQLDVQKANMSVPQFHRIGTYIVECLFANGRNSCSRSMRCGDRSIEFFKKHPSSSERSLSKRKGRWWTVEKSNT